MNPTSPTIWTNEKRMAVARDIANTLRDESARYDIIDRARVVDLSGLIVAVLSLPEGYLVANERNFAEFHT
jgi:hypothetical protein